MRRTAVLYRLSAGSTEPESAERTEKRLIDRRGEPVTNVMDVAVVIFPLEPQTQRSSFRSHLRSRPKPLRFSCGPQNARSTVRFCRKVRVVPTIPAIAIDFIKCVHNSTRPSIRPTGRNNCRGNGQKYDGNNSIVVESNILTLKRSSKSIRMGEQLRAMMTR